MAVNLHPSPTMEELNPTVDTTRFINTDDKPYDIVINNKIARHLEPGEECIVPVYVAQVGAKHLADRILYKQGIRDVNRPSPVRDDILAKIMPDIAEKAEVKPLSQEELNKKVEEELEKQREKMEEMFGKKDKEVEKLEDKIKKLEEKLKKVANK